MLVSFMVIALLESVAFLAITGLVITYVIVTSLYRSVRESRERRSLAARKAAVSDDDYQRAKKEVRQLKAEKRNALSKAERKAYREKLRPLK